VSEENSYSGAYFTAINVPNTANEGVIAKKAGKPSEHNKMEKAAPKHAPGASFGTNTPRDIPTPAPRNAKK
jgi:hypothetical protein